MDTNVTNQTGSSSSERGQIGREANGALEAPESIIRTEQTARTIHWKYRQEHLKRISLYSEIEGLIAGNPPYSRADLQKQGLNYIANFNTMDAASLYERSALAYWNLLNQAAVLVRFVLRVPSPDASKFAEIMARNWDFVVKNRWKSFYTVMSSLMGQILKFGISPILWPDENDWRFRVVETNKFFVPDQAQSDLRELTNVSVENIYTAQYLFQVYEKIKDNKDDEGPWDKANLANLLMQQANSAIKTQFNILDVMELQRKLQNGDLNFDDVFTDNIRLVSMFQVEYDGKVTHVMFHRDITSILPGTFLYRVIGQYQSIDEAIVIFTSSPGAMTIHSNRGLGHKIFSISQAMMQLDCSIVDMARWSSTLLLQTQSTGGRDAQPIRLYPGVPTNIGQATMVPNNLGANIQQLIGASQYLLSKVQFNTSNSGDDPGSPDRSLGSIAPSQARAMAYKEFGVLKQNIAHFYSQFDGVVQNMVAKMLRCKKGQEGYDESKEWKDRCIEDGVPPEIFELDSFKENEYGAKNRGLPKKIEVYATRVAGAGSQLAQLMGLQDIAPIVGRLGPRAARVYEEMLIGAAMGPDQIPALSQDNDRPDENAGGASLAGQENIGMKFGEAPVFSPDNEHRSHIVTHLALGTATIRLGQQGEYDPVRMAEIFANLIPHINEHMQALSQDIFAREFLGQVTGPVQQLSRYAELNNKNAARQLQAQAKQQQQLQEEQQAQISKEGLERDKMELEQNRADTKLDAQISRQQERDQLMAENQRTKIILDAQIKKSSQNIDNAIKVTDAQVNSQLETAKARGEVGQRAKTLSEGEARGRLNNLNGRTPAPYDIEG